jgi:thioredoxin-related protein
MKWLALIVWISSVMAGSAAAQDLKSKKLYDPSENAEAAVEKLIKQAGKEKKHVFIQVGYNGCVWCYRFHHFITTDPVIDSLFKKNYILYHLNTSTENNNEKLLKRFRYPQRFGFPVFVILDEKGRQIHIQDSVYLEEGAGYNYEKVRSFLTQWSPTALDPHQYKSRK